MGNQTAKQQVQRLSEINLTEAEQQQMEELLWQVDYPKFKQDYNAFLKKYNLNFDLKEMFTVHSTYEDDDSGQSKNESKTLLNEVVQKMTYGFTSSEYKLNELQKGEFRNFEFTGISSAQVYQEMVFKKNAVLLSLYVARNKGGGVKSRQTLLEFFKETTKQNSSNNTKLSLRIGSLFNPTNPLTKLQEIDIESYYTILKEQIQEMLGSWQDADTLIKDNQFEVDMQMLPIRNILVQALEDDKSGKSDQEIRSLSLRMLTRMGMLTKNPETLLMACYFQQKLELDITHELKPFLSEAEVYEKPKKEIIEDEYVMRHSKLTHKVPLLNSEDLSEQMSLSYDAFAADKDYFYNYSELRGLTRASKGPLGNWKEIDAINSDCKGLKCVSMVIHQGKLLIRHEGQNDQPFVEYDKCTLMPVQATEETKFKHPKSDDQKLKKLDWSDEKLPKTEEDDEEEKLTDEQKAEEEQKRPRRKIGATPLASDGNNIYALSMQVQQEESDKPLVYEKLTVEVFEIGENNEVKRVKEFTMKKAEAEDLTYEPKKYNSDGGYFNHAQCVCNGRVLILNLPHKTYFFDVEKDGVRFRKTDKRTAENQYQVVYDQDMNIFSAFQINRFQGYHHKLTIKGFEKRRTEEEINLTKAPEVLKSGKDKINAELEAFGKETKSPEKINMYEQLITGKINYSKLISQTTENLKKREQSQIKEVNELSQAIILTTLAQKADQFDAELEKLGQNTVIGEELFTYFRKDYCIYLTKTMFKYLNLLSVSLCKRKDEGDLSICILPSLSALIRLIKINLRCLAICKINLDSIILPDEYESFNKMRTMYDSSFGSTLKTAVEVRAVEERAIMVAKVKAKAEEAKLKVESSQEQQEEEKKAPSEAPKTVQIKTDGSSVLSETNVDQEKKTKEEDGKKDSDKEKEKEKEDEETVEFVEKLWKSGVQFAEIITNQAKELENLLNKIFNSTNPCARMTDLANNLLKAQNGDAEATKQCIFIFNALSNDKNMKEIFGGKKEDFEHFQKVIKICIDLTQSQEMQALKSETIDSMNTKSQADIKTSMIDLQNCASNFLKHYVRLHCQVYGDLLYEIKDTDVPPKKEPKEGEEEEKEDDETQDKRKRNEQSKQQLEVIKASLFYNFILLSQKYSEQLDAIIETLDLKKDSTAEFIETMERFAVCFESNDCQSKNIRILCQTFNFLELDVQWLDEVSEGLKNIIAASNRVRNYIESTQTQIFWKSKQTVVWNVIIQTMRQAIYTLGAVAHQLISPKEKDKKEEEEEKEKESKDKKIDFSKFIMLQGGLESKFIPELSDKTKELMVGFFKITQDDQLREQSLKKADQVELSEEHNILIRIAQKSDNQDYVSIDNVDYLEQTIQVIQHVACQKKGPLMRIGGNDGMRLTRAAFAVIIKFSEQISLFQTVWDEIESIAMTLEPDIKGPARLTEISKQLRDSVLAEDFEALCLQWEQSSQIRKWTQELKRDLTESFKNECREKLLEEINEKMKKEKEEKAKEEEKDKESKAEKTEEDAEKDTIKETETIEETKMVEETKEVSEDKSKDASKLDEESKEESKTEENKKDEEKKGNDDEDDKEEDDEEDGDTFTGPLNSEQQSELEDRAYAKMTVKMAEQIDEAVKKAKFILKLILPEAYQKQKTDDLQRELSRKQSQNVEMQTKGSGLLRAPSIKKQKSFLLVENTIKKKETAYDWKDRLNQWNQVQLSLGTISSISELGDAAQKSIPLSTIHLMQSKFTLDKLIEDVESVMISGLRRSAGLSLISFAVKMTLGLGTFLDLLQWFQKSLRSNRFSIGHYSDKIQGCGESVLAAIRKQFFKIIKTVILKIKEERSLPHLKQMINSLRWDYKGIDYDYLVKLNIFDVIQNGDGSKTHPITLAWGKQIKQQTQSNDKTLTRSVTAFFEFLFKQILSQVIQVDSNNKSSDVQSNLAINKTHDNERVSFSSAQTLVSQAFNVIFSNLRRYQHMVTLFEMEPQRLFLQQNSCMETVVQNDEDLLADNKIFIEEQGGLEKVKKLREKELIVQQIKINLVREKVLSQAQVGQKNYCTTLVKLILPKMSSEVDSEAVLGLIKERDLELEIALRDFSFEQLDVLEPSEQQLEFALQESKAQVKDVEAFKKRYERVQELLQKMNQKLADKEIKLCQYKDLFKRFANSIPVAWLYTLYNKDLDKYWRDNGNFDKEEFRADEKCKGISDVQCCLSKETEPIESEEEVEEEKKKKESRFARKSLCKKCFWFGVLLRILDAAPSFENSSVFASMITDLPSSCAVISQEPDTILSCWLNEIPQPLASDGESEYQDHWIKLLQKVKTKASPEIDEEQKSKIAQEGDEEIKQEQPSEEQIITAKLEKLRKIKADTAVKKHQLTLKNLYHETSFYKLLGMIDFYTSLAQISPATLAHVKQFADPDMLNVLIKFLIGGLSKGKILILRIFQDLMKIDLPTEILDKAVEISCKNSTIESPNSLDVEVNEIIQLETCLDLSNSNFFKMIYSMILKVQNVIWNENKQASQGQHVVTFELARVFKSLTNNGEKNIFNQTLIQSKIKETLIRIESFSGPEIETIMSIISETSPNQIHVGSACSNPKNQVFTVIGFSDKGYDSSKNRPEGMTWDLEFDPTSQKQYIYGLYYDSNSPERQEIIECRSREAKFVRDINDVRILNAARKSPFYDQDLVKHFLQILQGQVSCELPFTQDILISYIIRGFDNMVQIMHNKYIKLLSEAGVSKDLVTFIVKGASEQIKQPKDAIKPTLAQSEIKLDQMRMKALKNDTSSLKKSTFHELHLSESRENAFVMIQEDKNVKYLRLPTSSYLGFDSTALKVTKKLPLKVPSQININDINKKVLVILDSKSLMSLEDKTVLNVVKTVNTVLTDDSFSLAAFVSKVELIIEEDKNQAHLAKTAFITVSQDALSSLRNSVSSQESNLIEHSDKEMYCQGMQVDGLTRALSKLSSKGVSAIMKNFKLLIDFKEPLQEGKTEFDQIEEFVLKHLSETLKGEEYEKKKKEIQEKFNSVTEKKPSTSKDDVLTSQNKPVVEKQIEEEKQETTVDNVKPTVQIDTTGGVEQKHTESVATPSKDSLYNDAKSDIQRDLNMTNDLNNHATLSLERNDLDKINPDAQELQDFFVKATEISDKKVALHEIYKEELHYQKSLQCKDAFFNLLTYGYKSFESIAQDIEMSNESFAQLQDLIFNEMSESNNQSDKNNDQNLMKVCRKKIKKTYKLFLNSAEFEKFAIQDLVSKGQKTIQAIRSPSVQEELDLDELTASNISEKVTKAKVYDPVCLSFLTDYLMKMGKLSLKTQGQTLVNLYEIFLSFSFLMGLEEKAQKQTSDIMLQSCINIMTMVQENIEDIENDDLVLDQMVNNQIMKWICTGLNFDTIFAVNSRKNKLMLIQTAMYQIQGQLLEKLSKQIEVASKVNRFITSSLKQKAIFEDGKDFNYLTKSLQLKQVLSNDQDAFKVKEDARVYMTDKQMYKIPLQITISSGDQLQKLHFNKISSQSQVKLQSSTGVKMKFGSEQMLDGFKNFILDQNSDVQLTLMDGSQTKYFEYDSHYKEIGFEQKLNELEKPVSQIACAFSNTLFVMEDESLYAIGRPNTHKDRHNDAFSQSKSWYTLSKPSDCTDYLKVVASGSNRLILTKSGLLFCQGENLRLYIDAEVEQEKCSEEFVDCTEVFPLEDGDQIIDVAAGYFFTIVVTDFGHAFAVGHGLDRIYQEQYRTRKPAYQIDLPGRATKCWATKNYELGWIEAEDDSGNRMIFGGSEFLNHYNDQQMQMIGLEYGSRTYGEYSDRAPFNQIKFPDNITIQKIQASNYNAFALDSDGCLWVWCRKLEAYYDSDYDDERPESDPDLIPDYKNEQTPVKIQWFQKKGMRVLDISSSYAGIIIQTIDRQNKQHLYALCHPDSNYEMRRMIGEDYKSEIDNILYKITAIECSNLLQFACGSYFNMFLNKPTEKAPSIIPGREKPSGLTHAYKDGKTWKFIAQDEYEERKMELPNLSFAIQYPFVKFEQKALALPDLFDVQTKIGMDQDADSHQNVKSSVSGTTIGKNEPLYCSVSKISGKDQTVYLTETETASRDSPYLMNPLIFYRISRPAQDISKLPPINLAKFYEQSQADEEQIKFSVKKVHQGSRKHQNYIDMISDDVMKKSFEDLKTFKVDDDRQLMRCIDKFIAEDLKKKDIHEITVEDFDFKKFALKNENLKNMPKQLLSMRCDLFLKFTKQFIKASPNIEISNKVKPGSLSYFFIKNKALALSSAKDKILDDGLQNIGTGYGGNSMSINRIKASSFALEGKVDHEGLATVFGQAFQACKQNDPSYTNFRQLEVDGRCWRANFVGEDSIDAGGPFRESLYNITKELESEVLPLLIKTSNNRNDHGTNRDCFMINPSSRSPTHLEMFKFLGAFLSYALMTKSPIPIHLAPSVWKQLINQELTQADLEGFDAYSSQVLVDLRDHSSQLSDSEFEKEVNLNFKTILSNGDEVSLKPGEEIETVTKDKIGEYIELVLKTRFNESKEQIDAMREGIQCVFTDENVPYLQIMDWEQVESRACGEKTIEIEKLQSITQYSGCTEKSAIIKRFWRVLTSFDDEQRQKYLKFVWSRSRIPINTDNLRYKHHIYVNSHMNKTGFPEAHTCFFQLDLPLYSNEKLMRQRILTAIDLCGEIDND